MAILHMAQARKNVSCAPHRNANGKHRTAVLAAAGIAMLGLAGCRQDMHNQPKMIPQRGSVIFADHRSARPQVPNTVARGIEDEDSYFYTGLVQGANGYKEEKDALPFPVSMTVLEKGQERFNIYCTPCHDYTGSGKGMIVQRGFPAPPSYHTDRLRNAPAGHFFDVITNGHGAMFSYAARVSTRDRWAIVAYIRALQLSQHATLDDVPAGERQQLVNGAK